MDTSKFMLGWAVLHRDSMRAAGPSLAKAVAFTVDEAKRNTPFAKIARIDARLGVTASPGLLKSGKPSKDKKRQREVLHIPKQSVAVRTILARLNPKSRVNRMEDRRHWYRRASFSPGEGKAGFWAKVQAKATRMVKAAHSSTHFLQISWNPILLRLAGMVPPEYRAKFLKASGGGANSRMIADFGSAHLATNKDGASLEVYNDTGGRPKFRHIAARQRYYARLVMAPVFQRAIDSQFQKQLAEAMRRGLVQNEMQLHGLGFVTKG